MNESIILVDPDQRPNADVVIFDGFCRFCTGQVERLARWDRAGHLAFCSLHDPRMAQRYPDLTHSMLMQQLYVVTAQGARHGGVAALRYLSRRIPRLWVIAPLLHIPFSLPVWQLGYQVIARQRYRFGHTDECDDGSCAVHRRDRMS